MILECNPELSESADPDRTSVNVPQSKFAGLSTGPALELVQCWFSGMPGSIGRCWGASLPSGKGTNILFSDG